MTSTVAAGVVTSAKTHSTICIDGFNLAGVTAIKFNGVPASISSNSATQVVTAVPEGALSGPVTVITTNGTAESPGAFTVTGPAAPPVAGVYEGLLQSKREDGSGYLKVNVARTRWFTAQLKLEGAVYRFSGLFNAGGAFRAKLKRGGVEVLVELSFTGANAAPRIAGVIAADGRLYSMNAAPAIYSTAVPAPQQGRYTVLVQPDPGTYPSPQFPQGYGYATMRVSASGSVKLVGKLGDLQPFSSSSLLKDGALFPLYASLYKKPFGSVAGELAFTQNSALSDFEGTLLWIKPAQPAGVHPEGFSMKAVPVIGSRYVAPSKGTRALDWNAGSGHLTLKEGYLSTVLNAQLTLSLLNKLSVESSDAARLTVSISPSTGWFQGSFIHPFTEANVRFAGALFQAGKSAGGAFICADQSGMVTMSVCPP